MEWIWHWLTVERIGLISVGAVLFGVARWIYFEFHANLLPSEGEPISYVEQLTERLPNGRIFRISIHNISRAPIWLEEMFPRSRAFGRILFIPAEAFSSDVLHEIDAQQARHTAPLRVRVEAECSVEYHFWIGGLEWPIWRFAQILRWSPHGPAARTLKTIVHCAT